MESTEDRVQYVNELIESIREQEAQEDADRENSQTETEGQSGKEEGAAEKEGDQNNNNNNDNNEGMPNGLSTPVNVTSSEKPKKKKKKKKSKTAGLPEAGTELADDYKEKYNEDVLDNPYDPERPLAQRVEYAIWKYRKNHRFSEAKKNIFDSYLRFGGITTGPNAFMGRATGGDQDADGEADWEAAKIGTDVVNDDDEELEVNFTEVAQVYLGNTMIREARFIGLQDFIDAPILVDAFLRYLQIRNVCPEYADDIARARAIVDIAKVELPMCKRASTIFPGEFNKVCGVLFQGGAQEAWFEEASWLQATSKTQKLIDDFKQDAVGSIDEATKNRISSIVGDYTQRKVVEEKDNLLVKIFDIADNNDGSEEDDNTLIKVILVDYEDPEVKYEVLLERLITKDLRKGFVMMAAMNKLDTGIWYLDRAWQIMPTFFMEDDCLDPENFFHD